MLSAFLNLLLPPICPVCERYSADGLFCPMCIDKIRLIKGAICHCCGIPFASEGDKDHLCGGCIKEERPFSAARSIGIYDSVLLDAIHRFKYNGKTLLARPLAKIMAGRFSIDSHDLIVPVPLHRTRLRERGFNQALLLSRELAKVCNLPVDYLNLKRIRATEHQVNLNGKERLKNVRGAFAVEDKRVFKGRRILLIDDVYTTGATVAECSKVLKSGGAKGVDVLTLARVVNL